MSLTADQFKLIWETGTIDLRRFPVFPNLHNFFSVNDNNQILVFTDCNIGETILIESSPFYKNILLNNCYINLMIEDCQINSLETNSMGASNLSFENITIDKLKINNNCNKLFIKKSKINSLELFGKWENVQIKETRIECLNVNHAARGQNLTIDDSKINDAKILHAGTAINAVYVNNSLLRSLTIDAASVNTVRLDKKAIVGPITIKNKCQIESLTIADESQTGYITITENSNIEYLFIKASNTGVISTYKSDITYVTIQKKSNVFGLAFEYLYSDSKELIIEESMVGNIILAIDNSYYIKIHKRSEIYTFRLTGIVSKDTVIQVADTKFNNLSLESFINKGVIIFSNIMPLKSFKRYRLTSEGIPIINNETNRYEFEDVSELSELKIVNSDMGKTQFIGCDLQTFNKFIFFNSKMLEVFVADTLLPNKEQIGTVDKAQKDAYIFFGVLKEMQNSIKKHKSTILFEQQRLALSQFKRIYEQQGDTVRALDYRV